MKNVTGITHACGLPSTRMATCPSMSAEAVRSGRSVISDCETGEYGCSSMSCTSMPMEMILSVSTRARRRLTSLTSVRLATPSR